MKKILILALILMSAKMLYADEYLYDTIWNRQIPGTFQMLSPDRQKAYYIDRRPKDVVPSYQYLYSMDINTGKEDTITRQYTVMFSPDLKTYLNTDSIGWMAFRIGSNELIKNLPKLSYTPMSYSTDGKYLVSITSNQSKTSHRVDVYETENYDLVFTENFLEEASMSSDYISFSPNSKKFLIKSTAPNKPNTQIKFHIYEFETWKKYDFLTSPSESGYLRDDDNIVTFSEVKDFQGNVVSAIPITYNTQKEQIWDFKSSNKNVYYSGGAKNYSYFFLDKYNFENNKVLRYSYPNGVSGGDIILYNDSILTFGSSADYPLGIWMLLKPTIILGLQNPDNQVITLYPNPSNGRLILTNPQNYQINTLTAYDILGRTYSLSANGNDVDVSGLAVGRYFLKVVLGDGSFLDFGFVVE